jgi:hypothetical protein
MYVTKLLCTCRKRIKWKKRKEKKEKKEKKQKKQKLDKRKEKKRKDNKIKYIIYTVIDLPRQWRQKLDTIIELMSAPKCRSVEVINNPARPGSIHREVNYINYK